MIVMSPTTGKIKSLKSLKDGVFSELMMGDGVVITQTDGVISSPISGKLTTVFHTGHAFGIVAKDGTAILIHIGLDTVNLDGEGFDVKVKQGKKVKAGQTLVNVNLELIKDKVPNTDVIVLVTQDSKTKITTKSSGEVTSKSMIMEVE